MKLQEARGQKYCMDIFPPFSEERIKLREKWNKQKRHSWDEFLKVAAVKELGKLEKQKDRLKERYDRAATKSRNRFSSLGWGHGMRYSKITVSFTKEDEIKEKLNWVEERINQIKESLS